MDPEPEPEGGNRKAGVEEAWSADACRGGGGLASLSLGTDAQEGGAALEEPSRCLEDSPGE